ncbi:hypothetical protein Cgig2_003559 [Carnegiea gigantea]|uniref:Uncharacterized protein n=1 Tax=Carnegiea gigantea TaxID=171969 RepID=A0A9Q1GV90_9CARY|nr:hypothetical protein Cgig2_003559 [Carnegiea gigantea]
MVLNVFSNDDVEVCHEHALEYMHDLWTNWRGIISQSLEGAYDKLWIICLVGSGAKTRNEPSFLQIFNETHKKGSDYIATAVAQKYLHSGPWRRHKAKDIRELYSTRPELEVELNASRRKNEWKQKMNNIKSYGVSSNKNEKGQGSYFLTIQH